MDDFDTAANAVIEKIGAESTEPVVEPTIEPVAQEEVAQVMGGEESTEEPAADGYLGYEEYIEQGRDPDFYRGPKAYEKQKELIAQAKESDNRYKSLDENMFKLQQFNEQQREQEQHKLLREKAYLENQLLEAREGLDFDKHDAVKARIDQVDQRIEPAQPQGGEADVFTRAREADPRLNFGSPSFDKHYNGLVQIEVNDSIEQSQRVAGRHLTDNEVMEHIIEAKKIIDVKFKPQAKPRQRPAEVSAPSATAKKGGDENFEFAKSMFTKWSKSNDPTQKAAGDRWLLNNIK